MPTKIKVHYYVSRIRAFAQLGRTEARVKLRSGRIRGVAWAKPIITAQQIGIEG